MTNAGASDRGRYEERTGRDSQWFTAASRRVRELAEPTEVGELGGLRAFDGSGPFRGLPQMRESGQLQTWRRRPPASRP